MFRSDYLEKFFFDWELLDVVIGGKSSLDVKSFMGSLQTKEDAYTFLESYGFNQQDPILRAELFGIFQEALQFIRRYFIGIEGFPELQIPPCLYAMTEVSELFLLANNHVVGRTIEEAMWAGIVLKVMHTILHTDKDLRNNYFGIVQQQIFDRFYKFLKRDEKDKLALGSTQDSVPLLDFQTKSRKTRDSTIIKLLHKAENIAEELFDRIGVRFITYNKFDCLRVVKFVQDHHLILAHNIKPSRSINSLINLEEFKKKHRMLIRQSFKIPMNEQEFYQALVQHSEECPIIEKLSTSSNPHTSKNYSAIHFTARQLIVYRNPFAEEFREVRKLAREKGDSDQLAAKIIALDMSSLTRELRFFFPFEVQIVDQVSHRHNTEGEASHSDYKKAQVKTAYHRLFGNLLEYKGFSQIKS